MGLNWLRKADLPVLVVLAVLCGLGLTMIYSATGQDGSSHSEFARQARYLALGGVGFLVLASTDYRTWRSYAWALYLLGLAGVGAVAVLGVAAKGAQRWLELGPLGTVQPSEPLKLVLLILLARVLADHLDNHPESPPPLLKSLVLVAVPAALVMLQPDLGTGIVLVSEALIVLYVAGVAPGRLAALILAGLVALPNFLHDYQRERLLVFLNPEHDPTGSGWNLIQARIAIGAGRIWGQGLFEGTQKSLHFVPEQHTDFVFTVVGEELGLVGALSILALFGYLLWFGLRTAACARDRFGSLLATGIVALLAEHVIVNIGMVVGLMPVTGLPLPFLSYGGSALITHLACVALLVSIYVSRHERDRRSTPLGQPLYEADVDTRQILPLET